LGASRIHFMPRVGLHQQRGRRLQRRWRPVRKRSVPLNATTS
jgi:hypothetical protein